MNADAIAARLRAGAADRTGSPTAAAISAAAAYLTGMQTDHPQYLMLVTDQAPTCAGISGPLSADPATLSEAERARLTGALAHSKVLQQVYSMRQDLAALWDRSTESSEQLLARLQDWCHRAEVSGIAPLAQFSLQLRRYA